MTFEETHGLIKKGDIVSLRHELERGMSPDLSNQFNWNLLMLSALEGDTSVGELLIFKGAILDKKNDFGETALSLAAHRGHLPFIRLLLANGASKNCRPHGHSLDEWIKIASGFSQEKITLILDLLNSSPVN